MERKLIGRYPLGTRSVELYACPGVNGFFSTANDKTGMATIEVGVEQKWPSVVAIALHEALEMACCEMGLRFIPSPDYSLDNGGYMFAMDHTKFSEASARAAWFLAAALPDLSKCYARKKKGSGK